MSPLWSSLTRGLKNREGRTGDVFPRPLLWICDGNCLKLAAPAFDFSENRHYPKPQLISPGLLQLRKGVFAKPIKEEAYIHVGGEGGTHNRTKKAFQNKLHSSAGQNTFWIDSFQYKLEVGGGGLISEGFTVVDPREGPAPTPLENVQSGTQAPWSCPASGPLQNLRNNVSQNIVAIGTSSRHDGRTTWKCCAIQNDLIFHVFEGIFFPARFPICFLFGFSEFQTDRFDFKKPDH